MKVLFLKKFGRGALTLKDFAKTQSHVSVEVIENGVDGLTQLVHETLEGLECDKMLISDKADRLNLA